MRSVVVDGNFKADHVKQKRPEDDVWLTSGEGIFAERTQYLRHLEVAKETKEVCPSNQNGLSALMAAFRGKVPATVPFGH